MKKILCVLLLSMLLPANSLYGEPGDENVFFRKMWQKFSEVCNDASNYVASEDRDSRTVLEMLTLREPKYARLLKEAREILGDSETSEQFEKIETLKAANREMVREMAELKRKRISAPESSYNPLTDTKEKIDKKLRNLPEKIAENQAITAALMNEIRENFSREGINLSEGELEYFLVSAEGSELVHLMNIAANMKNIQNVIERELENDRNNVELAKIYTGMYLVSLEAYSDAHDVAAQNIGGYREKLKNILQEAQNNYEDARKLRKNIGEAEQANINANMAINERTMEVAAAYDGLLERRLKNLSQSKNALKNKIALARNTYKTILNGRSLIALVNDAAGDYALLINFEMPELKNMYDTAIMTAFADIADQIKMEK